MVTWELILQVERLRCSVSKGFRVCAQTGQPVLREYSNGASTYRGRVTPAYPNNLKTKYFLDMKVQVLNMIFKGDGKEEGDLEKGYFLHQSYSIMAGPELF